MLPENITACLLILLGNAVLLGHLFWVCRFKWNKIWLNILNFFLPSFAGVVLMRGWNMLCSFYFASDRVLLYTVQVVGIVLNMIVLIVAAVAIKKRYQTK